MVKEKQKHYFGEFNRNGYTIWLFETRMTADPEYQAGNCKCDSSQYLPIGAEGTLDITTIEEFCDSTGQAIAKENGGEWTGCEQVDDDEPTISFDPNENGNQIKEQF